MSDADDYARLMAAFDALEDAEPADRAATLEALRARDATLARRVEALWAESERDRTVMDRDVDLSWRPSEAGEPDSRPVENDERPLPVAVGASLGAYTLTEVIGRGGMGCVYRAVHTQLGRVAAIKVLDPRLTEDTQYVTRFLHEAKAVSALRHPNIVEVFDFIETEAPRRVAFVMAFLPGVTLAQVLKARALSLEEVQSVGHQLCDALEAVHAQGIVHRDLKPENVMVMTSRADGRVRAPTLKLLDFGIAKVPDPLATHQTATGVLMGTPTYMAPEQFAAEPPTPATDIYALAELLYEMLTQRPVFSGRGLPLMRRKLSAGGPALELPGEVSESFVRVLQDCLRTSPEGRPSIESVREGLSNLTAPPEDDVAPMPDRRPRRRQAFVVGAVAVAMGTWASSSMLTPWGEQGAASAPVEANEGREEVPRAELPAIVYGEPAVQNTPYQPTGYMGDPEDIEVDTLWTDNPRSGHTCLRISYVAPTGWAGLAWLDPPDDWGERPGGLALSGATRLSFWARSDLEGLQIKVGYGLLLKDVAFFDSSRMQHPISLTRSWKRYSFELRGKDLTRIKSGFYFVLDAPGPGGPHHFYFDDIRYE